MAGYGLGKFIKDATVNGGKLIDSTVADGKLATSYTKADGTRAFTGNQSMGGFKITNLAAAEGDNDVPRWTQVKAYAESLATGLKPFGLVEVLATANQTLSGVPADIDGITDLAADDLILLYNQTDKKENGPWVIKAGAWERPASLPVGADASKLLVNIKRGDTWASWSFYCTNALGSAVVGTDELTFAEFSVPLEENPGDGLERVGNEWNIAKPDDSGLEFQDVEGKNKIAVGGTRKKEVASGSAVLKLHQSGMPFTFKGAWDADTNDPALASGVGTLGDAYYVSVSGTTTLDGISSWTADEDWAYFDGTVWTKKAYEDFIVGACLELQQDSGNESPAIVTKNYAGQTLFSLMSAYLQIETQSDEKDGGEISIKGLDGSKCRLRPKSIEITDGDDNVLLSVDGYEGTSTVSNEVLPAIKLVADDETAGYVDLALTKNPVSASKVLCAPDGSSQLMNYARVGSTGASYYFRMGDVNKKRLYFKNVNGVGGDFSGGASGVTQQVTTDDIILVESLV